MEYAHALDRAFDAMPERPSSEGDRLSVPDPEGETDGAFTRLTNITDIADALSRDAEHLHRNIQRELGTNGQFNGQRSRFNGSFTVQDFSDAIDEYVDEFVACSECGLPDTVLVKENGIDMLRCQACGAFRPVSTKSGSRSSQVRETVEEGHTYEVTITGTGRKGDGVAEKGSYTIFVPGAREGQEVRIYIENVSGNLAFARLV